MEQYHYTIVIKRRDFNPFLGILRLFLATVIQIPCFLMVGTEKFARDILLAESK